MEICVWPIPPSQPALDIHSVALYTHMSPDIRRSLAGSHSAARVKACQRMPLSLTPISPPRYHLQHSSTESSQVSPKDSQSFPPPPQLTNTASQGIMSMNMPWL